MTSVTKFCMTTVWLTLVIMVNREMEKSWGNHSPILKLVLLSQLAIEITIQQNSDFALGIS
jgi:hypothetical protein